MTEQPDAERTIEEVRRLFGVLDSEAALRVAADLAERARNPHTVARALVLVTAALVNLGREEECPAVLDRAFELMNGPAHDHAVLGDLYALAGSIPSTGSLDRSVRHLVQSSRELNQVERPGTEAANAWHNLACAYSYLGFHSQAVAAAEGAFWIGRSAGLARGDHALPEIGVRRAVSLDHQGDSAGCAAALRDVLAIWPQRLAFRELWSIEQLYYDYAEVRLALLEDLPAPERINDSFSAAPRSEWEARDLQLLGTACARIIDGRPEQALWELAEPESDCATLGLPEIHRIRALAYTRAGRHRDATLAEREVIRVEQRTTRLLRDRLVENTHTQLDHEALQDVVEQSLSQAITDPLTGVPNRRHFEQHIHQVGFSGLPAVVGIIDVDDFKSVNTRHGHLSGDLVLQRIAGLLARSIRRGDFLARYGGDEFVIVLPGTDLSTARTVGERLLAAVSEHGWESIVPGTPVSVTLGFAPLADVDDLSAALESADLNMLREKVDAPTFG